MAEKYGLWPGVVALVGDADRYCVPCAKRRYGEQALVAVIDATPGYEQYTDHEGQPVDGGLVWLARLAQHALWRLLSLSL